MRATLAFLQLVLLYLVYWFVGMDEEGFQVRKGNYLFDLGRYAEAAKAYQRALKESQSPYTQAALGYCYLNTGSPERAVVTLTEAYSRKPLPEFGVALARSLQECGRLSDALALCQKVSGNAAGLSAPLQAELAELENLLSTPEVVAQPPTASL